MIESTPGDRLAATLSLRKIIQITVCVGTTFHTMSAVARAPSLKSDWKYVDQRLRRAKISPEFIRKIKKVYEPKDLGAVLELNTLLFLRTSDYHGSQVSMKAARDVREFVKAEAKTFRRAESLYHVSPEVIAGLIWMESRFGHNLGRFHVVSVFLDLLQADRTASLAYLRKRAVPKFTAKLTNYARRKIAQKAQARAKWAIGELRALEQMHRRDPVLVENLRGSFAGAFGMPQFEPSSYNRYAKAIGNRTPDLSTQADAIMSVANYLKISGWKDHRESTFTKALLKYNHSEDYARAILHLAKQARGGSRRAKSELSLFPSERMKTSGETIKELIGPKQKEAATTSPKPVVADDSD